MWDTSGSAPYSANTRPDTYISTNTRISVADQGSP